MRRRRWWWRFIETWRRRVTRRRRRRRRSSRSHTFDVWETLLNRMANQSRASGLEIKGSGLGLGTRD